MEVKTGYTFIKHYYSDVFDDFAHSKVTFEVAEDANIYQMLDAFEHFLKASGFSFDGQLDFVDDVDGGSDTFVKDIKTIWGDEESRPPRWAQENAAVNKTNKMSVFDEKM